MPECRLEYKPLSDEVAKTNAARLEEANARELEALKQRREAGKAKLLHDADVPKRLLENSSHVNFSNLWGERCNKLVGRTGDGFLYGLIGINGTGKSQMGVALIKYAIDVSRTCLFVHAPELTESIKDVYRADDGSTVLDQMQNFYKPQLLVIDEVNTQSMNETDIKYLHRIVCRRYDDMTDTLLISNDNKTDFQKLVGDRVVSRMIETGGIIEANWPSFRKAGGR